nr:LTA synthase family protein [uncultured Draconibacterium sp.]
MGFLFDLTVALSFVMLYNLYLLLFPKKWAGSWFDKIFTYFYFVVVLFIVFFSLMAEFPFWEEFGVRFNFIAVDYLIYTYEVVSNINESYPLPIIIITLFVLVAASLFLLKKNRAFTNTFSSEIPFLKRLTVSVPILILSACLLVFLTNSMAEFSLNSVVNEVAKNGVFSFFRAYRSNELDYEKFYQTLPEKEAYSILKKNLIQENQAYNSNQIDAILRTTQGSDEIRPNIVMVVIESFSGEFISAFGNQDHITPNFDELTNNSIFFTNLYATGTRTVRGMEALTLSVPPTPGNSIVRRPKNDNLFSIATILKQRNYHPYFIYGGDGYFDNMNSFFGGQGFDIVDRNRGNPLSDNIKTHRYNIPDNEVSFENAWGVCDEDLYKQTLKYADRSSEEKQPFFQVVMTTSNHRPYTFPAGKIDLDQGTRNAAVKYTDFALGKFLKEAKTKPWFSNTVFVVVADHCASSAGKWEININKHHIPAIIYNLKNEPENINRLTSQIDLLPTLLGYLNWGYDTQFYGKDINQTKPGDERAFIANYRTLGFLKNGVFTQVNDRKGAIQFEVSDDGKSMNETQKPNKNLINETISYYQTASERFKNGKMKTE